ncbi:MAG: hypothetical protein KDK25_08375, partial [Leptospiraceae bacterium]|nr:hypothetical protein [Leptospiraceae bacterium]
ECVTVFSSERLFRIHDLERDKLTSGMPESGSGRKISVLRSGQGLPSALEGLVPSMTRRIQFVRLAGAIRSSEKEPLFHCHPEASVWSEDRALLELGQGLLKKEAGLHLSVTTPFDLLKEIFTVKGAGTIIRNRSEILVYHSAAQVDRMRLMGLLEESFGRKLRDPDFFSSVIEYHIDSDYRGAILLEDYRGMRYLSKFAVGIQARGEGVAQELWESVLSAGGPLFWRSRRKNTIHRWYERLADGFHRLDQWTVYWKDVPLASVPEIVTYAMERPEDFSDFSLPPVPSDQTGP